MEYINKIAALTHMEEVIVLLEENNDDSDNENIKISLIGELIDFALIAQNKAYSAFVNSIHEAYAEFIHYKRLIRTAVVRHADKTITSKERDLLLSRYLSISADIAYTTAVCLIGDCDKTNTWVRTRIRKFKDVKIDLERRWVKEALA